MIRKATFDGQVKNVWPGAGELLWLCRIVFQIKQQNQINKILDSLFRPEKNNIFGQVFFWS
jgi:hypothetical protein